MFLVLYGGLRNAIGSLLLHNLSSLRFKLANLKYIAWNLMGMKYYIWETNMKHEDDELDPQIEHKYNKPWNFYRTKVERRREEIPSGMCLRKKL